MPYLYDGLLTSDVTGYVQSAAGKYPCVIEVSAMPGHDALAAAFAHRTYEANGETCMGQAYTQTRQGLGYQYVQKNFGVEPGGFLFLPDTDAHTLFVATFPELVVNPKPFKTTF